MRKILFFVLLSSLSFGQNKKIDSLKNELKKEKKDKFEDYKNIALAYINNGDAKNAKVYSKIAMDYAIRRENNSYIASSFILDTWNYIFINDLDGALKKIDNAILYAKKAKDKKVEAYAYTSKIAIFSTKGDHKNIILVASKEIQLINKIKERDKKLNGDLFAAYSHRANSFSELGIFDNAKKDIIILKKIHSNLDLSSKYNLNDIYQAELLLYAKMKDAKKAIETCHKIIDLQKKQSDKRFLYMAYFNLAEFYSVTNELKKSDYYLNLVLNAEVDIIKLFRFHPEIIKSTIYRARAKNSFKSINYDDAVKFSDSAIYYAKKHQDYKILAESYDQKADTFLKKHNIKKAIENSELSLKFFNQIGFKSDALPVMEKLINLYNSNGEKQKVDDFFQKYLTLKEEVINENITKSITVSEIKYETELKESQIKSQQLELEQEKINRNVAISGVAFLLLLSGGGFLYFRNHQQQKELQNQNTLLSLQQDLNAMELQSLNKQLDPHEIKNLLASISPEIQEKAPESYRKMLKLFNITKASLNNHSLTESIEIQIRQIEDFLSLEKMMLSENFEYAIENKTENKKLQIPRLMLKNLVENAIKHGIKGNGGMINIAITENNDFIYIIVDDSGKGRKQAIPSDSGIGTSTYQKLFTTLNQKNKENATFEIIDKEQGTKVEVKIPQDYKYH